MLNATKLLDPFRRKTQSRRPLLVRRTPTKRAFVFNLPDHLLQEKEQNENDSPKSIRSAETSKRKLDELYEKENLPISKFSRAAISENATSRNKSSVSLSDGDVPMVNSGITSSRYSSISNASRILRTPSEKRRPTVRNLLRDYSSPNILPVNLSSSVPRDNEAKINAIQIQSGSTSHNNTKFRQISPISLEDNTAIKQNPKKKSSLIHDFVHDEPQPEKISDEKTSDNGCESFEDDINSLEDDQSKNRSTNIRRGIEKKSINKDAIETISEGKSLDFPAEAISENSAVASNIPRINKSQTRFKGDRGKNKDSIEADENINEISEENIETSPTSMEKRQVPKHVSPRIKQLPRAQTGKSKTKRNQREVVHKNAEENSISSLPTAVVESISKTPRTQEFGTTQKSNMTRKNSMFEIFPKDANKSSKASKEYNSRNISNVYMSNTSAKSSTPLRISLTAAKDISTLLDPSLIEISDNFPTAQSRNTSLNLKQKPKTGSTVLNDSIPTIFHPSGLTPISRKHTETTPQVPLKDHDELLKRPIKLKQYELPPDLAAHFQKRKFKTNLKLSFKPAAIKGSNKFCETANTSKKEKPKRTTPVIEERDDIPEREEVLLWYGGKEKHTRSQVTDFEVALTTIIHELQELRNTEQSGKIIEMIDNFEKVTVGDLTREVQRGITFHTEKFEMNKLKHLVNQKSKELGEIMEKQMKLQFKLATRNN